MEPPTTNPTPLPHRTRPRRVAAAVIERDGRYLVCLRPEGKRHANLWEFPGGKVEYRERMARAIARELDEELELRVTRVGATLHVFPDPASGFAIHFVETRVEGEPVLHEHQAARWCGLSELPGLALAPSDQRFVRTLVAERIIRDAVSRALDAWGVPEHSPAPRVEFSSRLRASLGRCDPSRGLIRLRTDLIEDEHEALLREVVVHELARLVVYGERADGGRPDGERWRALVEAAGVPPRVRVQPVGPDSSSGAPG